MHVLPSGFMRIRHYGFLSNRCRSKQLELCRDLLGADLESNETQIAEAESNDSEEQLRHCPNRKDGRLTVVCEIPSPWISRRPNRINASNRGPPVQIAV